MEFEYYESEEEDEEGHSTDDDDEVSPSHVAFGGTAGCASGDIDAGW